MMRAAEIHARIGSGWPGLLLQLGIPENYLSKKHGPCPGCGGRDRYFFDDKFKHGNFFCRQCGVGDGFKLLGYVHGWSFSEARLRVMEAAGLDDSNNASSGAVPNTTRPGPMATVASPTQRVLDLLRESCAVENCADVMTYLGARSILPLPAGHSLRAHPSAEYFDEGKRAGRFAALIAPVRDTKGDLVTAHITYLQDGQKLQQREPRKLLSPLTGREGCAVRLMPLDVECMGVGEGIETCLAAAMLHEIPVWAALNTALLARFEPPSEVKHLVIFADRDLAGLEAAARLMQRLQDRATIEIRVPKAPAKDWADIGAPKALSATKAGLTPTGITPTEA